MFLKIPKLVLNEDQKRKAKEAETSHPQSSKVEKNRREYDLPFGLKKVAYKDKGRNQERRWTITIRAPNGKRFYSSKEVENFVKNHPEIEYDAKLTNTFRPPDLRKRMPSMTKVEEKKAKKKDDLSNPGQDPPKKTMEQEAIVVFPPKKMEDEAKAAKEMIRLKKLAQDSSQKNVDISKVATTSNGNFQQNEEWQHELSNIGQEFDTQEIKSDIARTDNTETNENDKESVVPQAERSHPEPSKIEKNRLEYNLPFGWKKIGEN